jgi:hypothetical protein
MKTLIDWIARISAAIGLLLMVLGVLSTFTQTYILDFEHRVNYFHMANSFFLITVVLYLHHFKYQKD